MDIVCKLVRLDNVGFMPSVLVEVHMAMAFLATIYRRFAVLKLLRSCLVWVWPIGIILGICVDYFDHWYWNFDLNRGFIAGGCNLESPIGEYIKVSVVLVAT